MASDLTSEEPEGGKVRFASGDGAPARSSTGGLSGGVEQCDGEPRGVPENQRERGEAVAGEVRTERRARRGVGVQHGRSGECVIRVCVLRNISVLGGGRRASVSERVALVVEDEGGARGAQARRQSLSRVRDTQVREPLRRRHYRSEPPPAKRMENENSCSVLGLCFLV